MPLAVVKAATKEAHRKGKLVFAHPSTIEGVELVIAGHVDGLAQTSEEGSMWDAALSARLKKANVTLIPTPTLFSRDDEFDSILKEVKSYSDVHGQIMYGTDIGYLTDSRAAFVSMPEGNGTRLRSWFTIEECLSPSTYRLFTPASWPRCDGRSRRARLAQPGSRPSARSGSSFAASLACGLTVTTSFSITTRHSRACRCFATSVSRSRARFETASTRRTTRSENG
jgi:hypothetical protein